MRAVVVRETGGIDVLRTEDIARPQPQAREVLIEIATCGICTLDIVTRNGTYQRSVELPLIPGHEICGTVVAAGAAVARVQIGVGLPTLRLRGHYFALAMLAYPLALL